ncbi:MAG: hypothetical protein QNK04_02195 [Myxococcota bacterium]|nr:hypothetical protein [Myxococcota bacterium]
MHRLSFDTNSSSERGGYFLHLSEVEQIGDELRNGLRVIIYMENELEQEAILHYDDELGQWVAMPDDSTIRYPDED